MAGQNGESGARLGQTVVGARYSHAEMIFQRPPLTTGAAAGGSSSSRSSSSAAVPPLDAARPTSPSRTRGHGPSRQGSLELTPTTSREGKGFHDFMSKTAHEWDADSDDEDAALRRARKNGPRSIEGGSVPQRPGVIASSSSTTVPSASSMYPGIKGATSQLKTDPTNILALANLSLSRASESRPRPVPHPGNEDDESRTEADLAILNAKMARIRRFRDVLSADNVDLSALRKLAWSGCPEELRPMCWQLLLGYLPLSRARRQTTLARKRKEYHDSVSALFAKGEQGLDYAIWHQIFIDVPRTRPGAKLWQTNACQRALERILYVWAIRHPASGYVQGINDLVCPFYQVFLSSYLEGEPEEYNVDDLPADVLDVVEADSFWSLSKLLDGIQDNYIFAQPGIQRQVARLKDLVSRIDAPLATHLERHNVEFLQFSFRWMNCLLTRELGMKNIIRMWDSYISEGGRAYVEFHVFVCAAFLTRFSQELQAQEDFQHLLLMLQALPTQDWGNKEIELLLSEAWMWMQVWAGSKYDHK